MSRVLITSGPTREYLDPVRFLSNASSGRMGAALAQAFLDLGYAVTVVSGPVALEYPAGADVVRVQSTSEMLAAALLALPACDGVVAVAAPCDFQPKHFSNHKIKKTKDSSEFVLELVKTPDIIATLKEQKPAAWFMGFALETEVGLENAIAKRRQKGCNAIVLNQPDTIGATVAKVRLIDETDRCVLDLEGEKHHVALGLATWARENLRVRP